MTIPLTQSWHPSRLMDSCRPGSGGPGWTWTDELGDIVGREPARFIALLEDVRVNGFTEPVLIGDDGRLWDGHHRVLVAWMLDKPLPAQHINQLRQIAWEQEQQAAEGGTQ